MQLEKAFPALSQLFNGKKKGIIMIRFRDKVFENYFIDPVTAVITDENGIVQPTYNLLITSQLLYRLS